MAKEAERGSRALLNQGEENEMELFGYRTAILKRILCISGYTVSLGALLLLFYWKPEWEVWANCIPCTLEDANIILLRTTDEFKKYSRKKVRWIHLSALMGSSTGQRGYPITSDECSIVNRAIMKPEYKVRFIRVQKIRFVWDTSENQFVKIGALEDQYSCADIHSKFGSGLTSEEQEIRQLICGPNAIEVEITPIWKLLFKEVLNPFYLFQAGALGLWIALGYYEVSAAIIIMTLISIIITIYDLRQQSVKLHELVEEHNKVMVTVCLKNGERKEVESRTLVPGDVIALTGRKLYLPCDALLVNGGCIVDEGMLTGESIPVTKTLLSQADNTISWKAHSGEDYKRHILFCGTNVIQTTGSGHGPGKAVVLQTGFNTAKGDLVRSILYPKPVNFKLHRDAFRFLMVLTAAGFIAMIYSIVVYVRAGSSVSDIVIMALLVITVAVPPALLAALSVGVMYAQRRLKKKGIFCISPDRINVCGQVNLVCFDKTGTLTEDGLDLWGIVPCREQCFQTVHRFNSGEVLPWGPLLGALASCHSMIMIDGKLQGDPLDLKMFEGTCWQVEDPCIHSDADGESAASLILKPGPNASKAPVDGIVILQQFPFSSSLQRMSVVTQVVGGDELLAFMKGAPEKVISFCRPETVPSSFASVLEMYTMQGFRVIGLAYKTLPAGMHSDVSALSREDVESNLEFLGLLVMENQLKPETKPVLQELRDARIRTVMVTGDNLQTALTVAKHSGMTSGTSTPILVEACGAEGASPASITLRMVENTKNKLESTEETCIVIGGQCIHPLALGDYHFAMDGKSFHVIVQHFNSLLPKLLLNGVVFARMSPGQKSSLVEELQKLDYCVGMCGDGANDCGALKMAHAGISLSEQEASVASPFTSRTPNIECVAELIKEGRCALVTSFAVFKYMTMYSMVNLICLVLLYWQLKLLGKHQYLITDVAITTVVCLTISLSGAYPKLAPYRPPNQLMSPPLLLSIFINILFAFIVQVCNFVLVQKQPWYNLTNIHSACLTANLNINASLSQNYEATTLFPLTEGNLIIAAFVFAKGKPFRKPIYTNYLFSLLLIGLVTVCIFLIFADFAGVYIHMELVCVPISWRVALFITLLVLFIVSYGLEEGIIGNRKLWVWIKKTIHYRSKSKYRKLQRLLEKDTQWPLLNRTIYSNSDLKKTDNGGGTYCNQAYENNEIEMTEGDSNVYIPA
ncbi:probable cation-transporting ATPase 13A4 isoform X2 [Ambystoma mexicanum]|uniref:probable cation-transporting ATPase 13A4 isoform X2 n=1 Tax=Ambystoma mexicanum TaxID=8296 RepID=UPI0037E8EFC1